MSKRISFTLTAAAAVLTVTLGSTASAAVLIDEDFQSPMLSDGTSDPGFTGWTWTDSSVLKSERSDVTTDVPGDPNTPNQVIREEWTGATASYETSHAWSSEDTYTLSLNASPQEWNGDKDRFIEPSLRVTHEESSDTVLWESSDMLPKYDNFGQSDWTDAQTFEYTIDASEFPTGTEGEPLSLKIAHSGQRGVYVDNVQLSTGVIPEPASLSLMGLGGLMLLPRRKRKV
jgi:hypothetical protein